MPTIQLAAIALACYLLGSLSPAEWTARLVRGIDLLRYGSGNAGGANVGEQLGVGWLLFVGALGRHKGVDVLLRAYGGLKSPPNET